MKFILHIASFVGLIALIICPAQAINLAKNGKTNYVIVTPANPSPVEISAANELKDHLNLITGADFLVVSEDHIGVRKNLILIGQTEQAKIILAGTDWKALGNDGIILRTVDDKLILTGGLKRGALYAVYTFLEDMLGVRWWTHNERFIPKKPDLNINRIDIKYVPTILCREAHFFEPNNYGIYAARTKQTGHFHQVAAEYGGHYNILGFCHTFFKLLPPEKYFAQHPEWYSLINGKRTANAAQLCLANEDMRRELVKNALELIKTNPEAGIISISQNDWLGECQCPECSALKEKEGASSGPLIHFVNKVADEINKEYPDFLIETLAYNYTHKAPRFVKPGKNVLIRLCTAECDYAVPLTDPKNKPFRDELSQWSSISHNLYIWNYIADFGRYLYPNPTLPVYEPNIKMFAQNKAVGVFMQGDSWNESTCFVRLRSWVIAHLLWNPNLNEKNLVKEFMDGYYGPAAPYLNKYLQLVNSAYSRHSSSNWMTPNDIYVGLKLFEQAAKAVAGNSTLLERVNRERLPLDYIVLDNAATLKEWSASKKKDIPALQNQKASVAEFIKATEKYNVNFSSENGPIDTRLKIWKFTTGKEIKKPAELGDLSGKKTIDIQETRATLYGEGTWVSMLEDPAASNGLAYVMPTSGLVWALQYRVNEDMVGKWHCYASVKIDPIANTGTAFNTGIYNAKKPGSVTELTVKIEDMLPDQYKLIDYGVRNLTSDCYFWFSPVDNPNEVKTISVDRVFLVAQ